MADPVEVPCPWPVDPGCLEDAWDDLDVTVQDRSIALASQTLRRLTGYRVGGCPVKVRPVLRGCASGDPAMAWAMGRVGPENLGLWYLPCRCAGPCSCGTNACNISLPRPATSVSEVKVDGVALDPDDYRLFQGRLVWIAGGECPFPVCQDPSVPDTEVGTMSVTYMNSYPVDTIGAYAAGTLAMEFAKACSGKKCALPLAVRTVARQGVTYDVQPGMFPDGFTGIQSVDTFISLWNPKGIRPPVVWSPDVPQRVGW